MMGRDLSRKLFVLASMLVWSGYALAQPATDKRVTVKPTFTTSSALISAVLSLDVKPGDEFDTAAQFGQRACAAVRAHFGGTQDTVFHFPVFGRSPSASAPIYDAEKQAYRFIGNEVFPPLYLNLKSHANFGLILANVTKSGKGYVGENAFGVKRNVDVDDTTTIALLIPGTSRYKPPSIEYHVPSEVARGLKGDLQLIIATRIASPCLDKGLRYGSPTIDNPTQTTEHLVGLVADSHAVWQVVRKSTGEVLASGSFR